MCGLAGELRFDGTAADVATLQRMTGCLERRGPDGSGVWARGPVALGHRRLSIIDLSVNGAQPMVDPHLGLTVVFNGIIYNYKQLRAELQAAGHRFFSTSDTEVVLKAYAEWGTTFVDHFLGMFAIAVVRAPHRPPGPRPRPARHQAALRRPPRRPHPLRLDAARAARRRRRRHVHRPDGAGPLHDLPLRRPGAAHDPHRRPQAAAGHGARRRTGRRHPRHRLLDAGVHPRPRPPRLDRPRLGGGAAGEAARRRRPADGRRRARRGAALRRHRLQPRRGAAGRGRPDGPEHVQHRLRVGRRGVRRRVRVLDPRRRAVRHPAPPHPDRHRPAAARPSTPRSPR